MKKAKTEKINKIKNMFFIAKAPAIFVILFILLFLFSVVFSMPFSYALSSEDYLRTDKEVYLSGEIVTIFIEEQSGTYIEIETPSAKYSSFGDAGNAQKFLPSENGNYKIILLDSENILATKSFRVVSEMDAINNVIDGAVNEINDGLLIINQSENNEGIKTNNVSRAINNITDTINTINNLFVDKTNNFSESDQSNIQRKSGDSLMFTDKKIYAKNELVNIFFLTDLKIEKINILSERAEYQLLLENDDVFRETISKGLNFIPDKNGSYIISVKLYGENAYYDISFYVVENASQNISDNISAGISESLDELYKFVNEKQLSLDNASEKNIQIVRDAINEEFAKKEKINIVNSRGEKSNSSVYFYNAQNIVAQHLDEQNGVSNISDYSLQDYNMVPGDNILLFEKYDVELITQNLSVKKLRMKDFVYLENSNIGIENIPKEKYKIPEREIADSYAINLEDVLFTEATATMTAKGEELWKCALWNFTEQACMGEWIKIMDIIPGEDYNILLYPGDPGYIETYSIFQSTDLDMVALDNNTLVLAWIDSATGFNISFQVLNVNGTVITPKTIVDATGSNTSRVSLAPINKTHFILSIFDQPQNNIDFFVFDRDGNSVIGRTSAAATPGANTDVSICQLGDRFPLAYSRTSNGDAELVIYYNNGTLITGTTQIDNNMAPELPRQQLVSCAAVNSTAFAYSWFDDNSNDMTFEIRSYTGTSIVVETDYDTDVGEIAQVASSSLGNNMYVTAFYDATDDDITIDIRRITGAAQALVSQTDIDTNAGTSSTVDVGTILMQSIPNFAVAWFDTSDTTIKAAVYNQTGSQVTAPFNVTITPNVSFPVVKVAGYEPVINLGLCNGTFAVAYTNRTGGSLINKYWYNGSAWDGICPDYVSPVINITEPANDSNITNNFVSFNFTGTDDRDSILKNCSLWTNFSGSWQRNITIYNVTSGSKTNITVYGLNDGNYIWNVQCFDNSSNGAFAPENYTLRINNNTPWIRNQAINWTIINQSMKIKFNATITDSFGIADAKITVMYPDTTEINYTLNNTGNEYYYIINETIQLGTYYINFIWAKDNLSQENSNSTFILQFNVTPSPPTAFSLIAPLNNTESQQLTPTFSWGQTTESNFANYTILVSKDSTFSTVDFVYATYLITETSFLSTYAMDSNTDYYWKVLANDIFGNQKNSTEEFRYITDTIGPTISLNTPANNSFWTTSNVLFNYTPTDANTLQSCQLYGNFTGTFGRNQTNTSITKNEPNYFSLNLGEGIYLWTIYCNDTSLNGRFSSENNTFFLDLSGPEVNLTYPENNALENNTNNVVFKVNATDKYTNISSCTLLINETPERTKEGITNGVEFNFTHFLLNGNYTWSVNCTDTNGFTSSSEQRNINVEVVDNNPPLMTLNYPGNNEYVSGNNLIFNYTPEDATGITNCSLYVDGVYNKTNTTAVENFGYNYFNVSDLSEGSHTWRVICYDNSTGLNQGFSNIRTFYVDIANPDVQLHHPGNLTVNPNWYLSNEEYRTRHKIDGSSSGNLTNYSINIIVHYGSGTNSGNEVYLNNHSKTDFGDIRFINEYDDAELGYYLESKTDGDIASFWVMIPSIDSVNGTYLYLYYGDGDLQTTSNGSDAFEFFDDFNNGLDKWEIDSQNTDAIVINSSLGNPSPGLVHLPDSSQTKNAYYDTRARTKDYKITDGIIEYDIYISGTSRAIHQFGWRVNNLSFTSGYAWRLQNSAADGGFFEFTNGAWAAFGTAYPLISSGMWHHVTINVSSSNYAASVNPGSTRSSSDNTKNTGDYLTSHVHATGTDYYVLLDNIRVRKFASSIPESSTWYSEEKRSTLYPEYVSNSLVLFNYTPQDANLASCSLYGNFSGIFEQDQTNTSPLNNQENIFTKTLEDGLYIWNVECFDLSGRSSFADINYSVKVDTTAPVYSDEAVAPDISSAYNANQIYYFNITWTDNFNVSYVIIEEDFSGTIQNTTLNASNGVGLYSFVTGNLSAGTYNYKWYAEDEAGNKNETDSYIYEVVKADSSVDLSLNSEQNNITVDETTPVNINASLSVPATGYVELYLNNVMINSGQSPLFNSTVIFEPGIYNVTAVYPSTQNYSSSYDTHYIFVNDTTPPFVQLISPDNKGFVGSGSATLQYSVSDKSSINECNLYINGLLNQTNSSTERYTTQFFVISPGIGNYNWSITCIDNNSNSNSTETRNFTAVNINTVKTFVNTSKQQYEKGEIGLIQTNTEDIYENALITNVTTDIIKGITSLTWWNDSWKYRKQIIINNTVSRDRTETIELNVTGLDNNISSCNELRIVKNSTVNGMTVHELLSAEIISGQNTSCLVRFNLELKANSVNHGNLFVYYGNPSAPSQGATVSRTGTWVQRGVVAGTTAALTATISSVSTDNTLVLHTQASTSSAPTLAMFTSAMSVATEITFTRYGSGTIGNISWQAIESSDIKVQRNTAAFAAATSQVNVSINSVNLSNSFIIVNGRVNSATTSTNNQGHFNARFLNSTTIQLERRTTGTAATAGWQVVEWNNSKVQSGNSSFTGYGINVTVNAVNLSRAMLFFGSAVSGGTGVGSNLIRGNITSSTTLSFERTYNVGTVNITWFLVELPEEFSVQANSISMSSDQNIGLTEIDYNKAFHTQSWSSTGTTSTTYTNAYILANLTNKTNILLNKQTTTNTHVVRVYTANTYTGAKGFGETQELIQRNTDQTDSLGYFAVTLNTSNLSYWNYTAISAATKEGFINETNYKIFEVIPDKTSPNVTLSSPENLIERGVGYLNFSYTPYDINLKNCSLYVKTNATFNILSVNNTPLNNGTNYFNNIYIDLGLQEWNVGCRDEEGNLGFAPQNRTLNITGPDLLLTSNDLYFGEEQRVEGTNITIFLNITNNGLTAVNNSFIVQFFKGDPDLGGTQIGYNITVINLSIGERITVNTTAYVLFPGRNTIYARVDFDNNVNETIESNNEANNNVSVSLYQYYYGNISGKIITAGTDGFAFIDFKNVTPEDGVIFFADEDSEFSFTDLKALTRNINNQLVGDDFSNLDAAMNTTDFEDSIKSVWGGGTDSPLQTRTFNVSTQSVGDVPVINSTNTSDFVTGILWDTNDDKGNLQYDATDKEDVVFVSNINSEKQGLYGMYDSEIKIPASLRNYRVGSDRIFMYVEIK